MKPLPTKVECLTIVNKARKCNCRVTYRFYAGDRTFCTYAWVITKGKHVRAVGTGTIQSSRVIRPGKRIGVEQLRRFIKNETYSARAI